VLVTLHRAGVNPVDRYVAAGTAADVRPAVVVDALGGGFAPAALSLLEQHGRYVVYGVSAGTEVTVDLRSVYGRGIRCSATAASASPPTRPAADSASSSPHSPTAPAHVAHFRRLWDQLWSAAAVGDEAIALIRTAMSRLPGVRRR
jgi:NADPH:quinone reductase-like Zn-dependent oxidoreductase